MAVGEIFERLHFPMLLPRVTGGLSPPTTVGLSNSSSTFWTDEREHVGDRHVCYFSIFLNFITKSNSFV
jgi:hypothetical protein